MTAAITGRMVEAMVLSRADLHSVDVLLSPLDNAAHPWGAIAHIAVGRGPQACDRADALAAGLVVGGRYRIRASSCYVTGTTMHLLGDVTIEPADGQLAQPAPLPQPCRPAQSEQQVAAS